MSQSIVISKSNEVLPSSHGSSRRFVVNASDPSKSSQTNALLGTACAVLIGAAMSGGVVAGAHPSTGAIVLTEVKVAASGVRSVRIDSDGKSEFEGGDDPPQQMWVNDIEWIKFHSDVSVSALAQLFGVTRKAFYGWMNGEVTPRAHRALRISALREALAQLDSREERTAVFGLLDRKVLSGKTIRGLIASSDEGDANLAGELKNALLELDSQIQKVAGRARRAGAKTRAFESDFATV